MGVLVISKKRNDDLVLAEISHYRAQEFYDLTQIITRHYKMEDVIYKTPSDEYWILPEDFCELVEKFFSGRPRLHYFGWAQEAIRFYEGIKGEKYIWFWPDSEAPRVTFETYGTDYQEPKIKPAKSS